LKQKITSGLFSSSRPGTVWAREEFRRQLVSQFKKEAKCKFPFSLFYTILKNVERVVFAYEEYQEVRDWSGNGS